MTKTEARTHGRTRRAALSAADVTALSQQVTDRLLTDFTWAGVVHVFLSLPDRGEVATRPLCERFWREHPAVRLATSRTHFSTRRLSHYFLTPETAVRVGAGGIPEPVGAEPCPVAALDAVLVPLLNFDARGQRVGYGGGFYDRFLAQCRPDTARIGLSLFDPIDTIADPEPTDVPLTAAVTPGRTYRF